jgi:hypothetical protein
VSELQDGVPRSRIAAGGKVSGSHTLERWLESHEAGLRSEGINAVAARAPFRRGDLSATWISFESGRSVGRVVLWSSGRCQLGVTATDGSSLLDVDRTVSTTTELDEALDTLTGRLRLDPRH